jgi:hypothetical protein
MKTENTLSNKHKFFSQYFGQHVLKHKDWIICVENNPIREDWNNSGMFLQLKSLDNISNKEMEFIFKTEYHQPIDNLVNILMSNLDSYNTFFVSEIVDKIRLNGFSWPWLDLSVPDLIDYGWIKLIK